MALDTRLLFYALVVLRRPRTICDVGSCDGTEAFKFRRLRPGAQIIAFEANPDNYAAICADPRSAKIEVRREAASDGDGEAVFYLLDVLPDKPWESWVRGSSSLIRRTAEARQGLVERPVRVPACRLDTALHDAAGPLALWVDVEGAASRVVDGCEGVVDQLSFMCIELEPRAHWDGQVEASQVLKKLAAFGFREVARGQDSSEQVNVVLARDIGRVRLLLAKALTLAAQAARAIRGAAPAR